ncbi:MAG: GNAT family N-acetyltransferase [Phycisphaerae bacterium]
MLIRPATPADADSIWQILEPVIRAGETYSLDRDMSSDDALAYWLGRDRETFVAVDGDAVVGTYYLRANQAGGGRHIANCGYMVSPRATGRGIARTMCEHSLRHAKSRGFRAMQFNFVVSSTTRAVAAWEAIGFEIVGRLPGAFAHPTLGFVDALVMFRSLID